MSTTHRKWRSFAAFTAAAALAISACGGDDDDAADTTTAAPDTTAAAPATTAAPDETEAPDDPEPADTTAPADTEPEETSPPTTEAEDELDLGTFEPISGVPGVTDDAISFGMLGTGPANPLGYCLLECYADGVEAYFEWRNSIGGVHGRQLEAREVDDELGNTQVRMLELTVADDVFGIFAAPLIPVGFQEANAAGTPLYSTAPSAPAGVGFDNVFIANTWCGDCPSTYTVHQAQLAGATKVASLGFGVSQASKDCVAYTTDTFNTYGPAVGMEFAYANDALAYGLPNGLGPEVTAMKDLGVDFITTCIDQNSVLLLIQELRRQGMNDTVVVLPQGYGDTKFITDNADLLEGALIGSWNRPFEADAGTSQMNQIKEAVATGNYQVNDYFLQGWVNADMAVTGLLAAGPQFDQAGVIAATNSITDYTAGGMIPSIDWSLWHEDYTTETMKASGPQHSCITVLRVTNGAFELLGDPAKPWNCVERVPDEWAEPVPTNF